MWLHSFNHDGAHENDDSHIATPCSTWFEHSCTHTFWKVRTFSFGYIRQIMAAHMKTTTHTSHIHVRHGSIKVARIHFGKVPVPTQRALPLPSVLTDAVSH